MTRNIQLFFICLLATLCTGVAFAQHVFVQTAAGVSVFKTDMAKVGSYTVDGTLVGLSSSHLISLENGTFYAYPILSNGGVSKEAFSVNTALYSDPSCGIPTGGVIRGSFVYATLPNGENDCYQIQTYEIETSSFVFKGASTEMQGNGITDVSGLPTFLGNGKFAYAFVYNGIDETSCNGPDLSLFTAESSGTLNGAGGNDGTVPTETWPTPPPGYPNWALLGLMAADSTDHVALTVEALNNGGNCGVGYGEPTYGPPQLLSATVNSQGNLSSTNTYKNMPRVGKASLLTINSAGTFLAAAVGTGTQVFKFHGASPITTLDGSPVIGTSGYIVSMAWSGDTLYAVNGASGKLHVYTVTTKVVEDKGSPYSLGALAVFVK